jgi:U32 family peptidase
MPTANALKPELLMPAGSPEKLRYAVAYGADAVYLGLPMASLRTPSRGEQFTPQNLGQHIHWAQAQGVKVYVTTNIFANNRDLQRLVPHFELLEALRPDAVILSDPGIFRLARKHAPNVPIHLSTQANTLNAEACAFWQDVGVSRVILAREVPVREMAEIHNKLPDLELECFVHGSICVAYSGRCMISDYLTDNTKNSNKGMCGNSCRWEFAPSDTSGDTPANTNDAPAAVRRDHSACGSAESSTHQELDDGGLTTLHMTESARPTEPYTFEEDDKGTYMLNSKDMCLVGALKPLYDAGICSFKVEGRTKSMYYAAAVTRVYRQAIDWWADRQWQGDLPDAQKHQWVAELAMAGNRGFTEGFLHGRPDDTAYNYLSASSQQSTRFLGTVNRDEQGQLVLTARNPFKADESTLEWLTPEGVLPANLTGVTDSHGLPLTQLQTNHQGWLAASTLPAGLSEHAILRGAVGGGYPQAVQQANRQTTPKASAEVAKVG